MTTRFDEDGRYDDGGYDDGRYDDGRYDGGPDDPLAVILRPPADFLGVPPGRYEAVRRAAYRRRLVRTAVGAGVACAAAALITLPFLIGRDSGAPPLAPPLSPPSVGTTTPPPESTVPPPTPIPSDPSTASLAPSELATAQPTASQSATAEPAPSASAATWPPPAPATAVPSPATSIP
ncbi:hypothetical protein [Streptomyces sp. NPDC018693]|uniref:hypothetical protein n=1 Tax=unclassified Streptomyces TaxID=2593676 RepID=UPI0037B7A129